METGNENFEEQTQGNSEKDTNNSAIAPKPDAYAPIPDADAPKTDTHAHEADANDFKEKRDEVKNGNSKSYKGNLQFGIGKTFGITGKERTEFDLYKKKLDDLSNTFKELATKDLEFIKREINELSETLKKEKEHALKRQDEILAAEQKVLNDLVKYFEQSLENLEKAEAKLQANLNKNASSTQVSNQGSKTNINNLTSNIYDKINTALEEIFSKSMEAFKKNMATIKGLDENALDKFNDLLLKNEEIKEFIDKLCSDHVIEFGKMQIDIADFEIGFEVGNAIKMAMESNNTEKKKD